MCISIVNHGINKYQIQDCGYLWVGRGHDIWDEGQYREFPLLL